jgi:16S rRNA (cytosine967-C5)-methyltransferase
MAARDLALRVLLEPGHFAWERLDDALRRTPLSPADRGLATELVYGTLRRRGSLDALIRAHTDRASDRIAPEVWELLRLGAYQLVYLSHVPPHAAIYETVELTKQWGQPKAAGFVNGVLRGLSRSITAETYSEWGADAVPLRDGTYLRMTRPVLPDHHKQPVEYLAAGFSLPRWLVERWLARYGWLETERLGFWFAEPAPLWVRVNPLRTNRDALRQAFAAAGVTAEPGPHPQSLRLAGHTPIRALPGYAEGWFTVQDLSAMMAASALAPEPGMSVLDLCAAPGGKTTHLAELMNDTGRIVACDVNARRLRTVTELCGRLGVEIVEERNLTPRPPSLRGKGERIQEQPKNLTPRPPFRSGKGERNQEESLEISPPFPLREGGPGGLGLFRFDAALVDVPCSNTGVLGRRPEVRWRLTPADLGELVRLQTGLLLKACEQVRPGGVVVYSTCSIEPEENGGVVRDVLSQLSGWSLEAEQEHRPGLPADGGYWARLRRSG